MPGKNRWVRLYPLAALAAICFQPAMFAENEVAPINDLPNPFRTVRDWGMPPNGVPWAAVTAVEAAPDGSIYVIHRCHENSCAGRPEPPILKFDPSGKLIRAWGEGMFVFPHGAVVDPQGNLWVTDAQIQNGKGYQVFKFNPDGKLLLTLGKAGVASAAPGEFDEPTDVAVAANGDIFITEGHSGGTVGNDRVSKFSKDGKFVKSWGKHGSAPGEFNSPHTIAIDSRGRLFVGDRSNNRIQIFDQNGKYLDTWRQFGRPSGIFIAKDDTMYVADSESWGPDEPGWKKGIRIGSAKTGKVDYFIEDMESTTEEHSGAEAVGVDAAGNVYGGVVRRRMLEKHIKNGASRAGAVPALADEKAPWTLQNAASRGELPVMEMLIKLGVDVNGISSAGNLPLNTACLKGNLEAVKLLLDHGADVKAKSKGGLTALHDAALQGNAAIGELLLEKGAEKNAVEEETGATPLYFAVSFGRSEFAKLMIRKGADVTIRTKAGKSPLAAAKEMRSPELEALLRQAGAKE